jgi:NarL family two-component system response regulator LiaR
MNKIRVVLADDHVLVREGIRRLIQGEDDMEVVGEAGDGEEACQLVAQTEPDIVLMDIAMPKVNGIEATRQIKESHPLVGVLILTAYDSEEFIVAFTGAGAAGYLLKNVQGRELLNSIRAVYGGEAVLHPAIAKRIFSHLQLQMVKPASSKEKQILTQRELRVLELSTLGLSNREVATELSLGIRTIQTHWRNIFNKLGVSSRTEAIIHGLRKGWITL